MDDIPRKLATVDICGVRRQVNVACIVDDAHPLEGCVGEWVLVHVGFAMARIDAQEAEKTMRILRDLGEAQAELESWGADAGRVTHA